MKIKTRGDRVPLLGNYFIFHFTDGIGTLTVLAGGIQPTMDAEDSCAIYLVKA